MDQRQRDALICVVDDSSFVRESLIRDLGQGGYQSFLQAETGQEALQAVEQTPPDIFLVDLQLPDMNGKELLLKLRAQAELAEIPALVVTSRDTVDEIAACFNAGADDYIHKPWTVPELLARVGNLIDKHRAICEREELLARLQQALAEVKQLGGLLPLCSSCKKIRVGETVWQPVDEYIATHSDANVSHSLCPDCLKAEYPRLYERLQKKQNDE